MQREKIKFAINDSFYSELRKRLEKKVSDYNQLEISRVSDSKKEKDNTFSILDFLSNFAHLYSDESIPTTNILKQIIETAFWASLQKEEGRELKFTISYYSLSRTEKSDLSHQKVDSTKSIETETRETETSRNSYSDHTIENISCKFEETKSLTTETLRKIAPALPQMNYWTIAVSKSLSNEDSLVIHGLDFKYPYEPVFKIKVLEPGKLIISSLSDKIAVISGDEISFLDGFLLSPYSSLWEKFGFGKNLGFYPNPKVDFILDTVRYMHDLGHGGTLIIVPTDHNLEESFETPISYKTRMKNNDLTSFNSFMSFKTTEKYLFETYSDPKLEDKVKQDCYNSFKERLQNESKAIASFTAVDGATIITTDLELVGFGAMIKRKDIPEEIPCLEPLETNSAYSFQTKDIRGARHRSALQFAYKNDSAMVFVVSQDGSTTAFFHILIQDSQKKLLIWYKKLELALF